MVEANYAPISNGVYRAGFAANQEAHAEAVTELFARLDTLESLLATRRYLLGSRLTAADLALLPTLVRFDAVYYIHFKCSVRRLMDYPNLWAYTRDLMQTDGIGETFDLERTKEHYYTSHESIHPRRYVPLGPALDFSARHDRARLSQEG